MFVTLGILAQGVGDLVMESIAGMSHALIGKIFERMLGILDKELEEQMFLMDEEEKQLCKGACVSDPNIVYFIDGCDFAIEARKDAWMWKTHKENCKKKRAIRAQILMDA